jgi:hypothetical protein
MKRLVSICFLLVLLGACGTTSGQPLPAESASTSPSASPTPDGSALSQQELRDVVLPLTLMPNGFRVDPKTDGVESDDTFCDYQQPYRASAYAEGGFVKGSGLTSHFILITLREYADVDQAAASFGALRAALKTCKTDTIDGKQVTYSPLSAPALGDASLGVDGNISGLSSPQYFTISGQTVIGVSGIGLDGPSTDVLTEVLRDQVSRYERRRAG